MIRIDAQPSDHRRIPMCYTLSPSFKAALDVTLADALARVGINWSPDAPGAVSLKLPEAAPTLEKSK